MIAFFRENPITLILLIIGGFFLFMTYGALIETKRSGRYVSGVPCTGGICIFLAFIISSRKILSLLCFLDYGFIELPYFIINGLWHDKLNKAFWRRVEQKGYRSIELKQNESMYVTFPEDKETYEYYLPPDTVCTSHERKIKYILCRDSEDNEFIAVYTYSPASEISFIPFDRNGTELVDGISIKTAKKP